MVSAGVALRHVAIVVGGSGTRKTAVERVVLSFEMTTKPLAEGFASCLQRPAKKWRNYQEAVGNTVPGAASSKF